MSCPSCSHIHTNVYTAVACYFGLRLAAVTPQQPTVVTPASPLPRRSWESAAAYAQRVERWHVERAVSHSLLGVKEEGGGRVVAGAPVAPSSDPARSGTSTTVLPDASVLQISSGRAGRSGRPRVPRVEQQRKAREHARAYRQRQHAVQLAAGDAQLAALGRMPSA